MDTEALKPRDAELEQAVLGAILLDAGCLDEVTTWISPDDFWFMANRTIFNAILDIKDNGSVADIDTITVSKRLDALGKLKEVGGMSYIAGLSSVVGTTLGASAYARAIGELAYRRRLLDLATLVASLAHRREKPLGEIHQEIEESLGRLGGQSIKTYSSGVKLFDDFVDDYLQRIKDVAEGRPHIGFSTGLAELDLVFDGDFRPGTYTVVYGPSGIGKSFLSCQMALAALEQNIPVTYITLENMPKSISNRMVSIKSGQPLTTIQTGLVNGELGHEIPAQQSNEIIMAATGCRTPMIEVVSHLDSAEEIMQHLRGATIRHGRPGICFVDTLNQLADVRMKDTRYENLTKGSGLLLSIMRKTGWGIIANAQLRVELTANMSQKAAKDRTWPTRERLEGSRAIGQHVDNLIGMYSSDYNARETKNDSYDDPECPGGHVLMVKVKGRETRPGLHGLIRWNAGIPRFETKGESEHIDLLDHSLNAEDIKNRKEKMS